MAEEQQRLVDILVEKDHSQRMVIEKYEKELQSIRTFSHIEKEAYEQAMISLQQQLNTVQQQNEQLKEETTKLNAELTNKKMASLPRRDYEEGYNLLRNYYVDFLQKSSREQAAALARVSKVIAIVDQEQ